MQRDIGKVASRLHRNHACRCPVLLTIHMRCMCYAPFYVASPFHTDVHRVFLLLLHVCTLQSDHWVQMTNRTPTAGHKERVRGEMITRARERGEEGGEWRGCMKECGESAEVKGNQDCIKARLDLILPAGCDYKVYEIDPSSCDMSIVTCCLLGRFHILRHGVLKDFTRV